MQEPSAMPDGGGLVVNAKTERTHYDRLSSANFKYGDAFVGGSRW
jgi:hypothetical protein